MNEAIRLQSVLPTWMAKTQGLESSSAASQGGHWQEGGREVELPELEPGTPVWDPGLPSTDFTTTPSSCSHLGSF